MSDYLRAMTDICEGVSLAYLVWGGMFIAFLLLLWLNAYLLFSDRIAFLLRWFRFSLFTCFIYLVLKLEFRWGGDFSLKMLSVLISMWGEFSYTWIKAYRYSRRNILPFSGFVECDNAWRPDKRYYKLKQDIEAKGFERLKSYKARDYLSLATLFYNDKEDIALLVMFSLMGDRLRTLYFFVSKSEDGGYLLFTNDFSQDILFLKGKYSMHYRPFSRFRVLFAQHKARMEFTNYVDFKEESKNLPHLLYNDNLQRGLAINVYSKNRNEGQLLTAEGRFQFCKKLIIKNFFRI